MPTAPARKGKKDLLFADPLALTETYLHRLSCSLSDRGTLTEWVHRDVLLVPTASPSIVLNPIPSLFFFSLPLLGRWICLNFNRGRVHPSYAV